jgi:hypothetical protein
MGSGEDPPPAPEGPDYARHHGVVSLLTSARHVRGADVEAMTLADPVRLIQVMFERQAIGRGGPEGGDVLPLAKPGRRWSTLSHGPQDLHGPGEAAPDNPGSAQTGMYAKTPSAVQPAEDALSIPRGP